MTTFLSKFTYNLKTLVKLLRLSLTSSKFYYEVFKNFKGRGFKYLFTLTFIGSLFTFCLLLASLQEFKDYLKNPNVNNILGKNLNHIFDQWPTLKYDGNAIALEGQETTNILTNQNQPIILFDPKNNILARDKENYLVIFEPQNIVFNFSKIGFKSSQLMMFPYTAIFGSSSTTIDKIGIITILKEFFTSFHTTVIYLIFPLFTLLNFLSLIAEKSLIVIFLFISLRFFISNNISIAVAIRLVAFATGSIALIKPLMLLFPLFISNSINLLSIWSNFLLILGVIKVRRNPNFYS